MRILNEIKNSQELSDFIGEHPDYAFSILYGGITKKADKFAQKFFTPSNVKEITVTPYEKDSNCLCFTASSRNGTHLNKVYSFQSVLDYILHIQKLREEIYPTEAPAESKSDTQKVQSLGLAHATTTPLPPIPIIIKTEPYPSCHYEDTYSPAP